MYGNGFNPIMSPLFQGQGSIFQGVGQPQMGQMPGQGVPQVPGQMSPLGGQVLGQMNPMAGQPQGGGGHGGFSPWMMMSPLMGLFASGHPNLALGMLSPGLGIARALGAFK
jgi:hypothetical protein